MNTCSTVAVSSGAVGMHLRAVVSSAPAPTARPDPAAEALAAARLRERLEAEARRRVDEEMGKLLARCGQCGGRIGALTETLQRQAADQVVEMALGLAEIVVRHQLPDREMLAELIKQTVAPLSGAQNVRVRLHPSDAMLFQSEAGTDASAPGLPPGIEVVRDQALACGDIVIENRSGVFDGRLDTRLALLAERLRSRAQVRHAEQPQH